MIVVSLCVHDAINGTCNSTMKWLRSRLDQSYVTNTWSLIAQHPWDAIDSVSQSSTIIDLESCSSLHATSKLLPRSKARFASPLIYLTCRRSNHSCGFMTAIGDKILVEVAEDIFTIQILGVSNDGRTHFALWLDVKCILYRAGMQGSRGHSNYARFRMNFDQFCWAIWDRWFACDTVNPKGSWRKWTNTSRLQPFAYLYCENGERGNE
jgi:hypothetical protein